VPQVDYDEQIRKAAKEGSLSLMPPDVLKAYKKHPEFFETTGRHLGNVGYYYLPIPSDMELPQTVFAEITRLYDLKAAQDRNRKELKQKIEAAANACTTLKSLKDMLPEFEKYMPADEPAACRTLPAVQNVVADFVKAGWPKNATKAAPAKRRI
jgi:hypothetical protein